MLLCWRLGRWEIVRPRRQWLGLLRGPSASPLGDARTMLFTRAWYFVLLFPYVLLAVGGFLLWKRRHSVATTMVGLGFAAVLLTMATTFFASVEYNSLDPQGAFIIAHLHTLTRTLHWVGLTGLWAASIGLIWHANQKR